MLGAQGQYALMKFDPVGQFLQMLSVERNAARPTLDAYGRDLADLCETLGVDARGLLRLGANESTAMAGLTELLGRLKTAYPMLQVELTIDVGAALSRKLNARELDIAILSDPVSAPHVIDHRIGRVELRWLAAPHLALPKGELAPADIAALPLLVMPPSSTLHKAAMEWLRSANREAKSFSTCNSLSLLSQLAAAGHGVTLLPHSVTRRQIEQGALRALPVKPAIAPLTYFVSHLRDEPGFADGAIVRMAKEALTESGLLMRGSSLPKH